MARSAVLGHEALWELGRALGIPDECPGIRSIVLKADVESVVTAEIGFIVHREKMPGLLEFLRGNRDRIRFVPTVTAAEPFEVDTAREHACEHRSK